MKPPISVIVPTANRPHYLSNSLESISLQSRKDLILEVLVSENSSNTDSKNIAEGFASALPIRWMHNIPNCTAQQHAIILAATSQGTHIALLADDDLWDRYHLEEAWRCFQNHPEVVAYFGQTVCVDNQNCQPFSPFSGTFNHLLSQKNQDVKDFFLWDSSLTAVNSLTSTPLNIWAGVIQTEIHRKALEEATGHPELGKLAANDSLYIWRLSTYGTLACGRHISLFYRVHSQSDLQSQAREDHSKLKLDELTIRKEIAQQALDLGSDPFALWYHLMIRAASQKLSHRIYKDDGVITQWLKKKLTEKDLVGLQETNNSLAINRNVKSFILNLTPPVLTKLYRRTKKLKTSS